MGSLVEIQIKDEVAVVTLNAPERQNAIGLEMRRELLDALTRCIADDDCRAIVLTGGGGHFSTGGDMKDVDTRVGPNPTLTRQNLNIVHDVVRLIARGPKPVVAAVAGNAFGAGMSLASACDVVVAAENARFCASFTRIGLLADCGLMWSLPRRIGSARARQLLLTARVVAAQEAAQLGLADEVVPLADLLGRALDCARQLSAQAPLAVAAIRATLGREGAAFDELLGLESALQPLLTLSSDYVEGRSALRERRPPKFRGR